MATNHSTEKGAMPSPRKTLVARKHIPRPPNAFILFRTAFLQQRHVSKKVEDNPRLLGKIIGLTWKSLSTQEQEPWYKKAKAAHIAHQQRHPDYAFRPQKSPKTKRTKVDGSNSRLSNERCKKIATFISQGMKGEELDNAMSHFDRESPSGGYDTIRWSISTTTDMPFLAGTHCPSVRPVRVEISFVTPTVVLTNK